MDSHQADGRRLCGLLDCRPPVAGRYLARRASVSTKTPFRAFYPPSPIAGQKPPLELLPKWQPSNLDRWTIRLSESLRQGRERLREYAHSATPPFRGLVHVALRGAKPWPLDALTYLSRPTSLSTRQASRK